MDLQIIVDLRRASLRKARKGRKTSFDRSCRLWLERLAQLTHLGDALGVLLRRIGRGRCRREVHFHRARGRQSRWAHRWRRRRGRGLHVGERATILGPVRRRRRPVAAEHHCRVVRLLLLSLRRRVVLLVEGGLLHVGRAGCGCEVGLGRRRLLRWLHLLQRLLSLLLFNPWLNRRFFVVVVT